MIASLTGRRAEAHADGLIVEVGCSGCAVQASAAAARAARDKPQAVRLHYASRRARGRPYALRLREPARAARPSAALRLASSNGATSA